MFNIYVEYYKYGYKVLLFKTLFSLYILEIRLSV